MSEKSKEVEKPRINIAEIIQDLKENKIPDLNEEQIKQLFNEFDVSKLNEFFNDSVKNLFDFGFKVANSLDLNKILDIFEEKKTYQNKE
ncbi:MAG: hypothetical protein EU541_03610 [Promethearchaeota archaeon]|nr:MAG: hypothetical protein EU541_03610 [Candidatus Lokiarchaeota archaeon]